MQLYILCTDFIRYQKRTMQCLKGYLHNILVYFVLLLSTILTNTLNVKITLQGKGG